MKVMKVVNVRRQRGVVLLIVLVLLFVVTLISMSGLQNATTQERMAANAQNINRVFQGGESAIVGELRGINDNNFTNIKTAMTGTSTSTVYSELDVGDVEMNANVQLVYKGLVQNDEGMTLGGRAGPSRARFEIIGSASMDALHTGADISQGILFQGLTEE